jgi:hypothetical protein
MRRAISISLVVATVLAVASGSALAAGKQTVNLSFFQPIATNGSNTDILTNFRLNLIYGHVGEIKGVDLNGLVSKVSRDVRGLQFTGLVSNIGGEMGGVALTGGVALVKQDMVGIQVTGISNYNEGDVQGLQYATLFNFAQGELRGLQWSPVMNLVDGDGAWFQLGGVANVTAGNFRGFQLGSGFNLTAQTLTGAQIGVGNFAHEFKGLQLGILNAAREAEGVAVALFNWQRHFDGVPVGLVNMSENGSGDWVTFGSTLSAVNTGVCTIVNNWSSVLYVGYYDAAESRDSTTFVGWQYGYDFALGESGKFHITPDLGYVHIERTDDGNPLTSDESQFAIQARASVEYRFNKTISVFLGGGGYVRWSAYSSSADTKTEGMGFGGLSLF